MSENKVLAIFDGGEFISAQITRPDGEVVVADYRRCNFITNPVVYREDIIINGVRLGGELLAGGRRVAVG